MAEEAALLSRDYFPAFTAAQALLLYQVLQLPDGRPGIVERAVDQETKAGYVRDKMLPWQLPKTVGVAFLPGLPAFWDASENKVHYKPQTGDDFEIGVFAEEATEAATTCKVTVGAKPNFTAENRKGYWISEATAGQGVTPQVGGGFQLAFDAVAEVAQAACYAERTFPVSSNWILSARVTVADNGDNAALDFDLGMASASHGTDFQAIAEFVAFHLDGNDLDLDAHSDDGTVDVAPVDTTVNLVEGTFVDLWIDGRNPASVKLYVDGVRKNAATTFRLDNATGPLKPIAHMTKTSDDTPASLIVDFIRVHTAEQ